MNTSLLENHLLLPSKIDRLHHLEKNGITVCVKRDDQIHPYISGNKWRKLKYNLRGFHSEHHDMVITLGGPFSNHLLAVAAACNFLNIPCVGLVRGKELDHKNPTLGKCIELRMVIEMVNPDSYSSRNDPNWISGFYPNKKKYFIGEGGSTGLFEQGVGEIMDEMASEPDYIVLPIGTGGTIYALSRSVSKAVIYGISPFKKGKVEISHIKKLSSGHQVNFDYALKGYGRYDSELVDFINGFWAEYGVPLDPIYNGKGMMALTDMMKKNVFPGGSSIMYIHTGGLQGIAGFNYVNSKKQQIQIPRSIYFPEVDQL